MDTYANGYNYGNYGHYSSSFSHEFWMVLLAILGVVLLVALIVIIIGVIGQWKMFKKAGKNGWEAIIPIYNIYTLCLITGVNPLWIVIVFGLGFLSAFFPLLSFISSIAIIYFSILVAVSTARSFGKEDGYALGLYFLGPFFQLALGIGKSEYLGPKPMEDIIFKSFVPNSSTTSSVSEAKTKTEKETISTVDATHFCTQCGTKIVINTKYCPNCGKEL